MEQTKQIALEHGLTKDEYNKINELLKKKT